MDQLRRLLPRSPNGQPQTLPRTRSRATKSRDGCVNCRARRRKCDEGKPSCFECRRRGVTCGGYRKSLKWVSQERLPQPGFVTNRASRRGVDILRADPTLNASSSHPIVRQPNNTESQSIAPIGELGDVDWARNSLSSFTEAGFDPILPPNDCTRALQILDSAADISFPQNNASIILDTSLSLADRDINHQAAFSSMSYGPEYQVSTPLSGPLDPLTDPTNIYEFTDANISECLYNASEQLTLELHPFEVMPAHRSERGEATNNIEGSAMLRLFHDIDIPPDSPENIARLYDRRVCEVLCMYGGETGNPWRKIVWPLAREHPALYHAVAAMTYFQMSKFISEGVAHFKNSIRELTTGHSNNSMRLEVALVITLVLAFAQAWHYPRSSNGTKFTRRARQLVQRALTTLSGLQTSESSNCLSFLANTWMYQDIITRITCTDPQEIDLDLMTSCSQLSLRNSSELPIDPLMGCAGTLFPLIGRVGDLVRRVRRAQQGANSPATVSYAAELKGSIEAWVPPIDLKVPFGYESPDLSTSDLVQTANLFKWSTILLLYQAVPELPRKLSFTEMAQKILILVATVSLKSRALIFHVLPLMIAGCEVVSAEDKAWVRSRWKSMSSDMTSGIVERCVELTLEVWRRRESRTNLCSSCLLSLNGSVNDGLSTISLGVMNPQMDSRIPRPNINLGESFCQCYPRDDASGASGFFDLSTFTTQTRPRMTSGHKEYLVTSRDHWFSVMEEWGWEVMLG